MTREQLEHAIRAACDVSGDSELWVFGSQAILGEFPDAPVSLRASIEVDVQPKNRPESSDAIDGALGELSQFHQTHSFYVHGILIESAVIPQGWEYRAIPIRDPILTINSTIDSCMILVFANLMFPYIELQLTPIHNSYYRLIHS